MAEMVFEDLSGASKSSFSNPYDPLIAVCNDQPHLIQTRYAKHRETRNQQHKQKFLSLGFTGASIDPVLQKLINPNRYPEFQDTRNCLVFWARPPRSLRDLVEVVQQQLVTIAPNLWLMPLDNLHMTALEITFSLTAHEIEDFVNKIRPKIPEITDYTSSHRTRLIKPMLSYDNAAIALSFEPAAGESMSGERALDADEYTYHHLRRDLYALSKSTGVEVVSRYVVPSAHLTVARFVTQRDLSNSPEGSPDTEKVQNFIRKIEQINSWLQQDYWPKDGQAIKAGGQWIVGQEKGLDCRKGILWYGGGETVRLGRGF
ncbi:MAG: hypothetical protein Q9214_002668 [Letrouitia sp. 1 TL-2023]